jgi:hypothetical protein
VCAAAVLDGLAAAAQINATMVLELLTFRSSGLMCGTDPSLSRKRARTHAASYATQYIYIGDISPSREEEEES